jgi:hypothetical protein
MLVMERSGSDFFLLKENASLDDFFSTSSDSVTNGTLRWADFPSVKT